MTVTTDNFNRANQNPLGSPWVGTNIGNFEIVSNTLHKWQIGGDNNIHYPSAASTNDQYSQAKIVTKPTGNDWGPSVRCSDQTNGIQGYTFDSYSNDRQILKHVNGSYSRLAGSGSDGTVPGDVERVEVEGSTIRAYINDFVNPLFTASDTSITSGDPGIFWYEPSGAIDDWEGGDLSAGTPYTETGTVTIKLTVSGDEDIIAVDAATTLVGISPSGTDSYTPAGGTPYTDVGTVPVAIAPSGVDSHEIPDSGTAAVKLSPSGVDLHEIPDSGTAIVALSPSSVDIHEIPDSGTVALKLTASGAEVHEIPDASTASVVVTPSSTDVAAYVDAGTSTVTITPSAAETYTPYGGTPYADSGTTTITFSPSGAETREISDSGTSTVKLTPTGTEYREIYDANLISLVFTPSATETLTRVDVGTVTFAIVPFGMEDNLDLATVTLHLTPGVLIEIRYLFDVLLSATLSQRYSFVVEPRRWAGGGLTNKYGVKTITQKWSAAMEPRRLSGSLGRRWRYIFYGKHGK